MKSKQHKIMMGEKEFLITSKNTLIDSWQQPFRLPYFNDAVEINIPTKHNQICNWNDPSNWKHHIAITINGKTVTVQQIQNFVVITEILEDFHSSGLELELTSEYVQVLEFYKRLIEVITAIMRDHIGNFDSRKFQLTINL